MVRKSGCVSLDHDRFFPKVPEDHMPLDGERQAKHVVNVNLAIRVPLLAAYIEALLANAKARTCKKECLVFQALMSYCQYFLESHRTRSLHKNFAKSQNMLIVALLCPHCPFMIWLCIQNTGGSLLCSRTSVPLPTRTQYCVGPP